MSGTMAKESCETYLEWATLMAAMEDSERTVPRTL